MKTTSATLLERIHRLDDQAAWDRFYQLYTPWIHHCALKSGCKPAVADDIVQETFTSLLKNFPQFNYEPHRGRFRGFLKTILHRRIADAFDGEKRLYYANSETEYAHVFDNCEAPDHTQPCKSWDDLWDSNLMTRAYEQVKRNIRENGDELTIEVFELIGFQGLSADEVREKIKAKYGKKITRNKIYQDKNRVKEMWKSELKKLREEVGEL